MITRLDKNRLYGEREALIDEASEESRLANINGKQLISVIELIHKKHDECVEALRDGEFEIDEVIKAYRKTIRRILKKL